MQYAVTVERDVVIPMRDGVRLYADVFRPSGDGPFPVLLLRTPYEKEYALSYSYAHPSWYAEHGYVVVVQDTRGRYRSEGEWEPFRNEPFDGCDTTSWASALPGITGDVGMYGASYPWCRPDPGRDREGTGPGLHLSRDYLVRPVFGLDVRERRASSRVHDVVGADLSIDTARRRQDFDLQERLAAAASEPSAFFAQLPLRAMPLLPEVGAGSGAMACHEFDEYWRALDFRDRYGDVNVPALHIGAWYDIFLNGTLRNFAGINSTGGPEARGRQRLLIGPWYHYPWSRYTGQLDFGADAASSVIDREQLSLFNWVLRGDDDGIGSRPPVRIFVMGQNRWRDEEAWPLKRAVETPCYFHSSGRAAGLEGDGTLSFDPPGDEFHDTYFFNPADPSPSLGGHSCCEEVVTPMGPYDQRPVERRMDVLCYTSEPLTEALEVTGHMRVTIWAATNAVDTDWVARLVDVHPDGRAMNLTEGIMRASYRNGSMRRELLERDAVTRYEIDLRATSNVFLPGHRLRVDIASASFPLWDRNPNTGLRAVDARLHELAPATQAVFHAIG